MVEVIGDFDKNSCGMVGMKNLIAVGSKNGEKRLKRIGEKMKESKYESSF